jgi:hypothetical protein
MTENCQQLSCIVMTKYFTKSNIGQPFSLNNKLANPILVNFKCNPMRYLNGFLVLPILEFYISKKSQESCVNSLPP